METFLIIIFILIVLGAILAFIGKIVDIFKPEQKSNYSRKNNEATNTRTVKFEIYPIDESNKTFIKMDFRVVGISYTQNTINACANTTSAYLLAENNPKDKNAVAVYNQDNDRIGYIPRGDKEFLSAFHSYKGCIVEIVNHYYNEEQHPVKYCELDIRIIFCANFEYLKKVKSEEPESNKLSNLLADFRKELKNKDISDTDKYNKITKLNNTLLEFNKRSEKVNWVTIPMRETIVLMNKLKLDTQLDFIDQHYQFSHHSSTQYNYIENYITKNKK